MKCQQKSCTGFIVDPSTQAPALARGFRSGFRPTVLPVGLHLGLIFSCVSLMVLRQLTILRNSLDGAFLDSRGLSVVRADELQRTSISKSNETARERGRRRGGGLEARN